MEFKAAPVWMIHTVCFLKKNTKPNCMVTVRPVYFVLQSNREQNKVARQQFYLRTCIFNCLLNLTEY